MSDPSREKILRLLRRRGEMKVGDIVDAMKLAQPTVSQHLKILTDVGALKSHKRGQETYYSICSNDICDIIAEFMKMYKNQKKK